VISCPHTDKENMRESAVGEPPNPLLNLHFVMHFVF
jgi:hypothetical protein